MWNSVKIPPPWEKGGGGEGIATAVNITALRKVGKIRVHCVYLAKTHQRRLISSTQCWVWKEGPPLGRMDARLLWKGKEKQAAFLPLLSRIHSLLFPRMSSPSFQGRPVVSWHESPQDTAWSWRSFPGSYRYPGYRWTCCSLSHPTALVTTISQSCKSLCICMPHIKSGALRHTALYSSLLGPLASLMSFPANNTHMVTKSSTISAIRNFLCMLLTAQWSCWILRVTHFCSNQHRGSRDYRHSWYPGNCLRQILPERGFILKPSSSIWALSAPMA